MQKVNARTISLVVIFLLILLTIALFVGKFTYSYLGPDIGDDASNKGEVTASGDTLIFTKGNNITLSATTDTFNSSSGNLTNTTNPSVKLVASSKTNNASATYYAGVKILENTFNYSTSDNKGELILTVLDENGNPVTTSSDALNYVTVTDKSGASISGFDITNKKGIFNIVSKHPINTKSSTSGTTHTWTFTLTFVNLTTDQSINENATLKINAFLQKDEAVYTLAEFVKVLYTNQGENGLYYHDRTLANGAGDNSYRYAGKSPNNYVCFGTNVTPCPEDNLYRIIGVFGDQVKVIKSDYATTTQLGTDGDYANTYAAEGWSTANYKGTLNASNIGLYHWNFGTKNNVWKDSILNTTNLNKNFLNKFDASVQEKIATSSWVIGGNLWENIGIVNIASVYKNEIVTPVASTTYDAKIGLMYVSDYGFAADPSAWISTLETYSNTSISSNNWMYMGLNEWSITNDSNSNNFIYRVYNDGKLNYLHVDSYNAIRPVFYLVPSIKILSGNGMKTNPYVLS